MNFTDYHSHFNPQHPQNPWMKYYNNTQRSYVLPKRKPLFKHFNPGYTHIQWIDLAQLEDGLIDIETIAGLTDENRTKLAQAKSKGLTITLIRAALTLGKKLGRN